MKKHIHIKIIELLTEKNISKNKICSDLNLDRTNFNRYCRDDFKRIDTALIVKLCDYFNCEISDLLELKELPDSVEETKQPSNVFTPIYRKSRN